MTVGHEHAIPLKGLVASRLGCDSAADLALELMDLSTVAVADPSPRDEAARLPTTEQLAEPFASNESQNGWVRPPGKPLSASR